MIIENVDALKSWLAKLLEPICDADPSALANYVVALVKKDKPEKELKALCADQLDVFLQKETVGFVDKLFECLTSKNYQRNPVAKEVPKEVLNIPPPKSDAVEVEAPEEERENRRRRSPLRNRSDFNESRSREDRRRDDRKRRDFDRHGKSGDSYRERERHERRRGSSRGRSNSRSRSGSRGKSRGRDFKSKFDGERKDADGYNSSRSQQAPPLLPTPLHPFPSTGGVAKVFGHKNSSRKQRCRDYDEKGFCVRGDLCPFDHGNDPLIVDDVNLPNIIPFPPPPVIPPGGLPMPPLITEPPPSLRIPPPPMPPYGPPPPPGVFSLSGPPPPLIATSGMETPKHQSVIMSSPPGGPPGVRLPPPLPLPPLPPPASSSVSLRPRYVQSEYNYDQEGYNPESPGLTGAGRNQYRQFIPRVQTQRPNLIGLTSSDGQVSRAANIVIRTEPAVPASTPGSNMSCFNTEQHIRKRPMGFMIIDGPMAKKAWIQKPNFNNKGGFPKRNFHVNTKLEVRNIPPELNTITKLNEHFSKFGMIVNIQVVFGGDPEVALIQFTSNEEARRAMYCAEAVLNNRFINMRWHRKANVLGIHQLEQGMVSQVAAATANLVPQGVKQHNPAAYVLNKNRSPAPVGTTNPPDSLNPNAEAINVALALTNTHKSPYVSTPLKTSSKCLGKTAKPLEAQEALKKKQEALKLQHDLRKKKQEMLKKQIECQKALINRLEKNRGMKAEERAAIMKTLKELTEKIAHLQNEMNPASQVSKASQNQPKTKTDAQKELLDAELDFHKKMSSGEDTTDLKRKLGQLQKEATQLGILRSPTSRGRGRGKATLEAGAVRNRGRVGSVNRMVVDHRPRALSIIGVTQEEKEELTSHFMKFGDLEDLRDQDATSVVMTFKTRNQAENAANQGSKFKGRVLQISWYKPKTPSVTTEPEEEESKDDDNTVANDAQFHPSATAQEGGKQKEARAYLPGEEEEEEEDDDEDDKYESRSWRR
ncbi:RNA-binding protein 27 isoform X2 [Stigmatopora argus]